MSLLYSTLHHEKFSMGGIHLLYFEKDRFVSSQVKMRLEWKGYQVTTIENEQALLNNSQLTNYDLLIIDFLSPAPNALTLLDSLRSQKISFPPTIMVSNEKDIKLVLKAIHLGSVDYVVKDTLIHNYIDQLNSSIFQAIEKMRQVKKAASVPIKTVVNSDGSVVQWEYNLSENRVTWNPQLSQGKRSLSYDQFIANVHSEDVAQVKTQIYICLFSHQAVEFSFRYVFEQNRIVTFHAGFNADVNGNGVVRRLYGELQIYSSEHINQNLRLKLSYLENTPDAVFIMDAQARIISVNKAFSRICGYSKAEILHQKRKILNTDQYNEDFFNQITQKLKSNPFWQGEMLIRHREGYTIPIWQSIHILKDADGNIAQSISVLMDLRKQKAYEQSIIFQANYDSLTGLPNRSLFGDRLTSIIKQAERKHSKFALMLLDLNKFKWINDTLGHHAGDILLQETAKKLKDAIRNTDTVARVGGDEFSIIVTELEKITDAELIARKIFKSFKQPIIIDKKEIYISGSIGISIFPDDGQDIQSLRKNADSAMYKAKNKDNNSYFYYTPALQLETERRLKLIEDMQTAIHNDEFSLHYQPIMDMVSKKVASAETLLRWKHPEVGYIPLEDFIPVAEDCGLIREIGNWVINEVAIHLQRWAEQGLPGFDISLNQSVAQYHLSECHVEWLEILKSRHISTKSITFEISENLFLDQKNTYLNSIDQLKQEGIQISLDGFGTGYSSLSYLQKFPVDVIKIDRSYIQNMLEDPIHAILVETIVSLANKLGIKVIATGVENTEQLSLLNEQCRYAQGYYFSKPLPVNEFEEFVKVHNQ